MRTSNPTLAAVAAAVLLSASAVVAQVSSVNGQIAFEVCEYNSPPGEVTCDIWVMNPDGSEPTNLTSTPLLNEMWPAWSPDGTRIAYVAGSNFVYTIQVMNADGSGQAPIVAEPSYQFGPTWSADGTQIAFTRMVPGRSSPTSSTSSSRTSTGPARPTSPIPTSTSWTRPGRRTARRSRSPACASRTGAAARARSGRSSS